MNPEQRVVVLGGGGGWHEQELLLACERRGVSSLLLPTTRVIAALNPQEGESFEGLRPDDLILVRAIPGGSLEQIIYRMDALHALEDWGCRVINSAECIERCVDKFHTSFLLSRGGLPTPRTRVAERFDDAMRLFEELGGDVVVKPLFGSEGRGLARVSDPDIAYRTFRVLEMTRSVFYLQEFLPSQGWDLRVFVLAGRAIGCMKRRGDGWKTNIAQGATPSPHPLTPTIAELAERAAALIKADVCGIDLYPTELQPSGFYVIEVNAIPGWRGFAKATGIAVADEIVRWALCL